jgi:hypothetical protein
VEHTQTHLVLKKGTKISIILAILEEYFVNSPFHQTKIPTVDIKIMVQSNFSNKEVEKK